MLKQKVKTGLFFGGVGILTVVGLSLIVHSCSSDNVQPQAQLTPQAQQQYSQLPPDQQQPQVIERERIVERDSGDHFWRDMYLYHALFGGSTHTVVYQPAPVYHPVYVPTPAPSVKQNVNVNKTVQNITINQTINHAPAPTPAAPVAAAKAPTPNYAPTPSPAVATAPAQSAPKSSWWASPSQVVKQAADYPKASNAGSGGYAVRNTGYSGYSMKSSYNSGGSRRSK